MKPETGTLPGTSGATTTQTKDPRAGRHLAVQLLLLNLGKQRVCKWSLIVLAVGPVVVAVVVVVGGGGVEG